MADDLLEEPTTKSAPPPQPVVIRKGRGCFATLVGSALTIVVSAALGAALAILFLWYGPRNVGMTLPDPTGRLAALEQAQQTAVIERTEAGATLRGLSDVRGSVDSLRESVQKLETDAGTRETNFDNLQKQIDSNMSSLLALQKRLDDLESIPANASLANRLADAELELATVRSTLNRLRQAFDLPLTPSTPSATAEPTATP